MNSPQGLLGRRYWRLKTPLHNLLPESHLSFFDGDHPVLHPAAHTSSVAVCCSAILLQSLQRIRSRLIEPRDDPVTLPHRRVSVVDMADGMSGGYRQMSVP